MNHCINERNTAVAQWSERPLGGGKSVLFQGWVTIDTWKQVVVASGLVFSINGDHMSAPCLCNVTVKDVISRASTWHSIVVVSLL